MMLKKYFVLFLLVWFYTISFAQADIQKMYIDAKNFEQEQNEEKALQTYLLLSHVDSLSIEPLLKCSELYAVLGDIASDPSIQKDDYQQSVSFANRALLKQANNNPIALALASVGYMKLSANEGDKKQLATLVEVAYHLAIQDVTSYPNDAMANFAIGYSYWIMLSQKNIKAIFVRNLINHIPKPSIDTVINYLKKANQLSPLSIPIAFYLIKAYQEDGLVDPTLKLLQKITYFPIRTSADVILKVEAKNIFDSLQ